jgi:circadian clock protein KaiC
MPSANSETAGIETPKRNRTNAPRMSTGCIGLDDVLHGGLPRNHLYLLEGNPGTGKTTLAMQFLLEGARVGEKALYVTLSESADELREVAQSHGWKLDPIAIFEMTPGEDELSAEAQYTVFHPSEVELADTTSAILKEVDRLQPQRVVLDSLSELRMLAKDALRYRRQVLALKRFFSGRNCSVLLLDDRTADGNDLQLQSIAHGVVMMHNLEREFGIKRRRLEIRKLRGSRYREGYHDFSIQTGGIVVHPRLVASEHKPGFSREIVASGLKELDDLFGGGIDSGTSTLLMGPAGCGKSTIAVRYALSAAERGDKALLFTFDEVLDTLLNRAEGLGMSLEKHLKSGRISVQQVDPAEMSPGEFIARVRESVRLNAKVVVIDSLNGFLSSMPREDFVIMQLHELLSYMNQQGVATILTMAQHGFLGDNMNSPVDISYLADSVLLFRYFESEGEVKQALSVVKKRSGYHERAIRELKFSKGGIRVGQPLTQFEGVLTGVPKFIGTAGELRNGADARNK